MQLVIKEVIGIDANGERIYKNVEVKNIESSSNEAQNAPEDPMLNPGRIESLNG